MKTLTKFVWKAYSIFFSLLLISTGIMAQKYTNSRAGQLLEKLPEDLRLVEKKPQSYLLTTDYYTKNLLGDFLNKMRITGKYTRGYKDGTVKWNDVKIAHSNNVDSPFPEGAPEPLMEDFAYTPSEKMLSEQAFENFPVNSLHLKNLVWDIIGFEVFAWYLFDSLKLNESIDATDVNGEVDLAGQGLFENRDIKLTWLGITLKNNKICAVVSFRAMDNPLILETGQFPMEGRSHYWGNVYVALEDKQMEFGELHEDVVLKMKLPGNDNSQLLNATREIKLVKLN